MSEAIMWFRRDLRLGDNPALNAAAAHDAVYPIYIYDERNEFKGASRVWLGHALDSLSRDLEQKLRIFEGRPEDILVRVATTLKCRTIYANTVFEPNMLAIDTKLEARLPKNIKLRLFNGNYLCDMDSIRKSDGGHYKVFTPFFRNVLERNVDARPSIREPLIKFGVNDIKNDDVKECASLIEKKDWQSRLIKGWAISEEGANRTLKRFAQQSIQKYGATRDFLDKPTSELSPYLHFGQISPHKIVEAIAAGGTVGESAFFRQLIWREFAAYSLVRFPNMASENMRSEFDEFAWQNNSEFIERWKKGLTGFPIIDAGMRQLWQTGYMHNRLRMITASFLTKNLMVDWRIGREWFERTLFDADMANNSAGWQWVAGSGIDSAPFFRIFNPLKQGEKYDPNGDYIRRYVQELSGVTDHIHTLIFATVPSNITAKYPSPMIDLTASRLKALEEYRRIRQLFAIK